jgi:lipopolysaccharide biosynthesis glycosyltransferase
MLFNGGTYAIEGWVCHYTLYQLDSTIKIYLLCIDDDVLKKANNLIDRGIIPISLKEFENTYPQLLSIKGTRALKEYIVTMKPFLPEYIFNKFGEDKLIFTDSDIAFWNNPSEIFNELDNCSFLAKSHEIVPARSAGIFNVGLLGYKNDENCREWLKWWQSRCIEWCKWIAAPGGKFAEQGYLNILHNKPSKFKGFLSTAHPGINLAPWNMDKHKVSRENGKLKVDGRNLICYHYHEFEVRGNGYHPTGWKLPPGTLELLYDQYFKLVKKSISNTLWK